MKSTFLIGAVAATAALAYAMTGGNAGTGLKPGERVTPFNPSHIVGPLAGTSNCFPCTMQWRPQVQVWVNNDSPENVLAIEKTLQKAMDENKKAEFKALVVYVAPKSEHAKLAKTIKAGAEKAGTTSIGIAIIDPSDDALDAYKISTAKDAKNTVYVYKNWVVKETMNNFKADEKGLASLNAAIKTIVK
ncbi:MAG: hypothetical protein KF857_08220 [Fimbriimonadaceae bacterium]|nr:hypothetical protein [Fimbriimonadaceae bacterium]